MAHFINFILNFIHFICCYFHLNMNITKNFIFNTLKAFFKCFSFLQVPYCKQWTNLATYDSIKSPLSVMFPSSAIGLKAAPLVGRWIKLLLFVQFWKSCIATLDGLHMHYSWAQIIVCWNHLRSAIVKYNAYNVYCLIFYVFFLDIKLAWIIFILIIEHQVFYRIMNVTYKKGMQTTEIYVNFIQPNKRLTCIMEATFNKL